MSQRAIVYQGELFLYDALSRTLINPANTTARSISPEELEKAQYLSPDQLKKINEVLNPRLRVPRTVAEAVSMRKQVSGGFKVVSVEILSDDRFLFRVASQELGCAGTLSPESALDLGFGVPDEQGA